MKGVVTFRVDGAGRRTLLEESTCRAIVRECQNLSHLIGARRYLALTQSNKTPIATDGLASALALTRKEISRRVALIQIYADDLGLPEYSPVMTIYRAASRYIGASDGRPLRPRNVSANKKRRRRRSIDGPPSTYDADAVLAAIAPAVVTPAASYAPSPPWKRPPQPSTSPVPAA